MEERLHIRFCKMRRGSLRTNLSGRTYGRWKIVAFAGRTARGAATYRCRCICGTEKILFANHVTRGVSKSCGCYRRELMEKRQTAALSLLRMAEEKKAA